MSRDARAYEALQEGVFCALATLAAIQGAGLLDHLPASKEDDQRQGHGMWLLAMLEEKLTAIQKTVVEIEDGQAPVAAQ